MCFAPVTLKKIYKSEADSRAMKTGDKFQGGIAHTVPCGKCPQCLRRRQSGWSFRLNEEVKVSDSACFITLTYDDEHLPLSFNGLPTLDKKHVQNFMKRLRKQVKKHTDARIKYYFVGEYGSRTMRPHYHAIMFNLPQNFLADRDHISRVWSAGICSVDTCTMASIQYVTKYVMKGRFEPFDDYDDRLPEFSLMSKKLGLNHLTPQMIRYYRENFISYATLPQGQKFALPRYFRERVFTKDERLLLNQTAQEEAEEVFKKHFDESYHKETQWKIDQYRKAEKINSLKRQGL